MIFFQRKTFNLWMVKELKFSLLKSQHINFEYYYSISDFPKKICLSHRIQKMCTKTVAKVYYYHECGVEEEMCIKEKTFSTFLINMFSLES